MIRVTITGSGTPIMVSGRAGPGVLVAVDDEVKLQFDAGRATSLRLTEAGVALADLTAVFITHHHSDHLVGLSDLAMSRWLEQPATAAAPLEVVAPDGEAATIAERLLDVWQTEMMMRAHHTGRPGPATITVQRFVAPAAPQEIFAAGAVRVSAVQVHHEPVTPAVAYRVDAADGSVVISGDTAVCPALEEIAAGATVLVQEAFRPGAVPAGLLSDPEALAAYHSEVGAVGEMAVRAGVGALILTHLIPPPVSEEEKAGFVDDVRAAGFQGPVVVADDLNFVEVATRRRPDESAT
jgi:ribonuclease Z